jgi:hypothetical protein
MLADGTDPGEQGVHEDDPSLLTNPVVQFKQASLPVSAE